MLQRVVLVTNDDGIAAPGLRALVLALVQGLEGLAKVCVCAPSEERSATSHCITIAKEMEAAPVDCFPGALAAYSVTGNPADCSMLALFGPLFQGVTFELVVSGINRGENAGLHVVYSGTVAGAREGVKYGVPGIAASLDDFARSADYVAAASAVVPLARAVLLRSEVPRELLLNVNVPKGALAHMAGYALTSQDLSCVQPHFIEVAKHDDRNVSGHSHPINEPISEEEAGGAAVPGRRPQAGAGLTTRSWFLKNVAGKMRYDFHEGSESKLLKEGWVTVTPLAIRQDLVFFPAASSRGGHDESRAEKQSALAEAAWAVIQDAAAVSSMAAKL